MYYMCVCVCASVNWIIIGSGNGLACYRQLRAKPLTEPVQTIGEKSQRILNQCLFQEYV